jgi:hypothetical protein
MATILLKQPIRLRSPISSRLRVQALALLAVLVFLLALPGAFHPSHRRIDDRALSSSSSASIAARPLDDSRRSKLSETYGRLPLSFEANEGQANPRVDFFARRAGYSLFLAGNGATIALPMQTP